jgi:hypothetical protein
MINEDNQPEIEYKPLDIEAIKKNIGNYTSEKLSEMIVCNRYFGSFQEVAIICMEELSRRRQAGQDFPFENYIEEQFNKLPELKLTGINLRDILQQAIGQSGKK